MTRSETLTIGSTLPISRVVTRPEETYSVEETAEARLSVDDESAVEMCKAILGERGCVSATRMRDADIAIEVHRRSANGLRDFYIEFEAPWPVAVVRPSLSEESYGRLWDGELRAGELARSGAFDAAIELQQMIVEARITVQGPGHRSTLRAANNHSGMMKEKGDLQGAARTLAMVVNEAEKHLGECDRDTLLYLNNFAEAIGRLGKTKESIALLTAALTRTSMVHQNTETATTIAAWQLFRSCATTDGQLASWVFQKHLRWLTSAATEYLSATQRSVRDELIRLLQSCP